MNDGKKISRWPKMLDEAGLLDDIDDVWNLPDSDNLNGSVITVNGSSEKATASLDYHQPQKQKRKKTNAVTKNKSESMVIESAQQIDNDQTRKVQTTTQLSRTPMEQHDPSRADAQAAAPKPHIIVANAKATMDGIPQTPAKLPSFNPAGTSISSTEQVVKPSVNNQYREQIDNTNGADISIAPESVETPITEVEHSIVDEPHHNLAKNKEETNPHQKLNQHYDLGDFSGALDVAEQILQTNPNDSVALSRRQSSREVLMKMYESQIGPMDGIPNLAITDHELIWRNLDAAGGFILSRIDGMSTYEDIIDVSGLPRFETCRILNQLLQEGIIK